MRNRVHLWVAVAVPIILMASACGRDDGASVRRIDEGSPGTASGTVSGSASAPGSPSGSASAPAGAPIDPATAGMRVAVTLDEWNVVPESDQAAAGVIAFDTTNEGEIPHELYITRAENAASLPTAPDGSVEEDQLPAGSFVGEIEEFPSGTTQIAAFEMQPGTYVLFCNIADDTGVHFKEGMHTTFTVT
jgi:hypothetical protein